MTLTASQSKVLEALRVLAKDGVVEASVGDLTEAARVSRGGVSLALQALEAAGLIARRSSSSRASRSTVQLLAPTVQSNRSTVQSNRSIEGQNRSIRPFNPTVQSSKEEDIYLDKYISSKKLEQEKKVRPDRSIERLDRLNGQLNGSELNGQRGEVPPDAFDQIAALYPRPENTERARNSFNSMAKRPDAFELWIGMRTSAELASRMPAAYVRYALRGKGLDWFVQAGWRDDWARLLEIEAADLEYSAAPGPQPVTPHRECSGCDEGWIYNNTSHAVEPCPHCRQPLNAHKAHARIPPRRAERLESAADLAKVLEFDR